LNDSKKFLIERSKNLAGGPLSSGEISRTLLRNNLNNNLQSKFAACMTVARGCTRDMQQTNYLRRINWNWAPGPCRLSDARLLTRRYFNLAFAIVNSTDRLAKISTSLGCNCGECRRVIRWPINRNRAIRRNRSFRLIARANITRSVPQGRLQRKKRGTKKEQWLQFNEIADRHVVSITLIFRDREIGMLRQAMINAGKVVGRGKVSLLQNAVIISRGCVFMIYCSTFL